MSVCCKPCVYDNVSLSEQDPVSLPAGEIEARAAMKKQEVPCPESGTFQNKSNQVVP